MLPKVIMAVLDFDKPNISDLLGKRIWMRHNGVRTLVSHPKKRIRNSVILLQKRPQ